MIFTLFNFKVKGQRTTYKFVSLPYDYHPGITRRRKKIPCRRIMSAHPEYRMDNRNCTFQDDPKWGATTPTWTDLHGRRSTDLEYTNLSICSSFHPDSPEETRFSNPDDGLRYDEVVHTPLYPPSSFHSTCPQTSTKIWFPEEARASYSGQERRSTNNWQTFPSVTPKLSHPSPPLQAVQQNVSRIVTPSDAKYAGIFLTPESSRSSSPLSVTEYYASRSDTPLAATCGGTFASVTPESRKSSSPLHVVKPHLSRNVTPTDIAYTRVRFPNSVAWRTPVYPRVNTVPYLPLMYVVPVPYERHHPLITGVIGNYQGHLPTN